MGKAYFRSYIRRYACSPAEIQKALNISLTTPDEAYEFFSTTTSTPYDSGGGGYDGDPSSAFPDADYDAVFVPRECPSEVASNFCFNGGECLAEYQSEDHYVPFCKCASFWHGRRCEYYFNPELYESARVSGEAEGIPYSSIFIVILIVLLICGLLYITKLCKTRDLRDFVLSESTAIEDGSANPVGVYPFSRPSTLESGCETATSRSRSTTT